jgi:hypothetical protein
MTASFIPGAKPGTFASVQVIDAAGTALMSMEPRMPPGAA